MRSRLVVPSAVVVFAAALGVVLVLGSNTPPDRDSLDRVVFEVQAAHGAALPLWVTVVAPGVGDRTFSRAELGGGGVWRLGVPYQRGFRYALRSGLANGAGAVYVRIRFDGVVVASDSSAVVFNLAPQCFWTAP